MRYSALSLLTQALRGHKGWTPVWRDPASGYLRRNVSPRGMGSGFEIVEVELPGGAEVRLDNATGAAALDQQIWVLRGRLDLTVEGIRHELAEGRLVQPYALAVQAERHYGLVRHRTSPAAEAFAAWLHAHCRAVEAA